MWVCLGNSLLFLPFNITFIGRPIFSLLYFHIFLMLCLSLKQYPVPLEFLIPFSLYLSICWWSPSFLLDCPQPRASDRVSPVLWTQTELLFSWILCKTPGTLDLPPHTFRATEGSLKLLTGRYCSYDSVHQPHHLLVFPDLTEISRIPQSFSALRKLFYGDITEILDLEQVLSHKRRIATRSQCNTQL